MSTVLKAVRKPFYVEYLQFKGWQNAIEAIEFLGKVGVVSYFVPMGYEDRHVRKESDYDRCNGHILEDAEELLVIKRKDLYIPVRMGSYIIVDEDYNAIALTREQFNNQYDQLGEDNA